MSVNKIIYAILEILLGVSMFIYGGFDDSPGGQLLGLVAIIFGTIRVVKVIKNYRL